MLRLRLPRTLLRQALLRPEVLLGAVVLLASLLYFLLAGREERAQRPVIEISQPEERQLESREVRLVRFDEAGLESPTFVTIPLPEAPGERLEAILAALRESMLEGDWPEALPAPRVFVENVGRQNVAVLDFRPDRPLALSVEQEERLLRSVEATATASGADTIRYLLGGEATGVFIEHLAVPAAL